ncbi:MAG: type II secretion system protein N [Armatimonadota bacterium]
MSEKTGQRQDVAFLAVVVAVLVVAVALFVGMKSIQRNRPEKPAAKPAKPVEVSGPVVPKPEGGPRDPFRQGAGSGPGGAAAKPGAGATAAQTLKLVGIVSEKGDQPVAIIHSARKRYYARVGDRVAGYTLMSVGTDRAVLSKGGESLTLVLREPEPTDE